MRLRNFILVAVLVLSFGLVSAQALPDPVQIYRTIQFTSDARAGDVRWIEIWETQDNASGDRQWVMVDLQGKPDGIESTCYHAVAIGGGSPVYFVDGELTPVDSAQTMFDEIENRRLVDQSLLYVENTVDNFDSIEVVGQETIAGIPSEQRTLTDTDASNLFLIKPPATSTANLWTAANGGYVTRYEFTADGSTGDVSHTYRLQPGGEIQPPTEVNMQCFEGGFPLPEGTEPLVTGNLTHGSFTSTRTPDQLKQDYEELLLGEWEPTGNTPRGGRIYQRTLANGSICRLGLEFQKNGSGAVMTARVVPDFVSAETFADLPDMSSPVVIQTASNLTVSVAGDVETALAQVLPDLENDGWVRRPELTDIRADSALVTVSKDGVDTHVIVDYDGANSSVRVQQREPVCGPTFVVP